MHERCPVCSTRHGGSQTRKLVALEFYFQYFWYYQSFNICILCVEWQEIFLFIHPFVVFFLCFLKLLCAYARPTQERFMCHCALSLIMVISSGASLGSQEVYLCWSWWSCPRGLSSLVGGCGRSGPPRRLSAAAAAAAAAIALPDPWLGAGWGATGALLAPVGAAAPSAPLSSRCWPLFSPSASTASILYEAGGVRSRYLPRCVSPAWSTGVTRILRTGTG